MRLSLYPRPFDEHHLLWLIYGGEKQKQNKNPLGVGGELKILSSFFLCTTLRGIKERYLTSCIKYYEPNSRAEKNRRREIKFQQKIKVAGWWFMLLLLSRSSSDVYKKKQERIFTIHVYIYISLNKGSLMYKYSSL